MKRTEKSKAPQSEARAKLAALIERRREIVTKIDGLAAAIAKLAGELNAAAPLEARLASLDASESSAMSQWAQAGADGPAPKSDAKDASIIARRHVRMTASSGPGLAILSGSL
jgi:hypothetical protein